MLHALGASDEVLDRCKAAWEGHLRQFTEARTTEVPLAREGMYYREFPTQFDWLHHSEGLRPFFLQGLSDPGDPALRRRTTRFAGFYTGADPTAPNYDPEHKVIRSLLNGSRGPLLRKATALDWAGDPIEVEGRFALRHGELQPIQNDTVTISGRKLVCSQRMHSHDEPPARLTRTIRKIR